ncbi:primase zinc finger [Ancylostoma caninum]|uniref:Protein MCM10 homolog n=1 Tax=Ancylostoma caninum TaxID=29170 RepID=A0A368H6K7_ANCCA|nr:primase zinc finger [Ancylostoma caninum]
MDEFLSMCNEESDGEQQLPEDAFFADVFEDASNEGSSLLGETQTVASTSTDTIKDVTNTSKLLPCDEVLDPDQIQAQIDLLERKKREAIERARATVFGPGNKKDSERREKTKKSGLKMVDLNFDPSPEPSEPSSSQRQALDAEESDDEMMDNKKELSEAGRVLQRQLIKQEHREEESRGRRIVPPPPLRLPQRNKHEVAVPKHATKQESTAPSAFDSFFQLKIRNPKISSSTFESYVQGFKRVRISTIKPNFATPSEGFVTAGVIVGRDLRKSASGTDYVMWKLHDLKNCQDQPIRLLLFGDAYKEHWKLQVGGCVALMSPQVADADKHAADNKFKSNTAGVTLKVFKRAQVVELGMSSDLGMCRGVKFDGQKCGNFVNTSLSEFCVHHVMNEARKLSANRGTFNSVMSQPPKRKSINSSIFVNPRSNVTHSTLLPAQNIGSDTIRPTTNNIILPSELKTTTKQEEKSMLNEIISGRAHLPGARNMIAVVEARKGHIAGKSKKTEGQFSMADFIKKQEASSVPSTSHMPQLGYGLRAGQDVSLAARNANAAKVRAAAILKREKADLAQGRKPMKRQADSQSNCGIAPKQSKLVSLENGVDLDKLLQRRSMHDSEANKAQGIAAQKHLDVLEQREKVETFVTECMSVKDVKVVTCKKCDYTSQKQSELCKSEGHTVKYTTAEKRFFKCGACHKRTVVFSMLPTKPCKVSS